MEKTAPQKDDTVCNKYTLFGMIMNKKLLWRGEPAECLKGDLLYLLRTLCAKHKRRAQLLGAAQVKKLVRRGQFMLGCDLCVPQAY